MIAMEVFMDIFALRRQGLSFRAIAKKLKVHRNTVKKYLEEGAVPPRYNSSTRKESILAPYFQIISDWLEQDDYRATWIYQRIRALGYGGGYDTVKHHVRKIKEANRRKAYIRYETVPGLQAQVDWADFQVADLTGAAVRTVYLFLMVLGFSRAMYAELVTSCTLQAFMDAHIRAFHFLGGVPLELLYDNMRHVVTGRAEGKAAFNVEFSHFARHYGFKPIACAPYSPWVKGKVERPVDYIRESFWRGYGFEDIQQANRDLTAWISDTANCRIHGTHREAVDVRWQKERACLSPSPATDYDTSLKVYRKVYKDCMISYNASRYQVPPDVIGKRVLLKIKDGSIRFYDDDRLLVACREAAQKGSWITHPEIIEQIHHQRQMLKENRCGRPKGKATRGLVNASLFPQVFYRPLSAYDRFAQGGDSWTN
jgi:transposase